MLRVVGAGVGRTGTNSLKLGLERLLGGTCHHMTEIFSHPDELPTWIAAIDGHPVDWCKLMEGYAAQVDWPGASFWPELSAANPDALIVLSVRDPDEWFTSCTNTIFGVMRHEMEHGNEWMSAMRRLFAARFSDRLGDRDAMIAAFERHNSLVREQVPASRLLEWTAADGWGPICERLGIEVPAVPFPKVNTTAEFRTAMEAAAVKR